MSNAQKATKDTTVRVPWELLEQMKVIAKTHERSLVAEVRYALNQYVRSPEAKRALQERGD
jgi:hypothetical protein